MIAMFVVEGATANFKQTHAHTRPNLGQLNALVAGPHEDVMSDFDTIFDIFECDHAAADLLVGCRDWSRRPQMLEHLSDPMAQLGIEIFENQMRIGLADSAATGGG